MPVAKIAARPPTAPQQRPAQTAAKLTKPRPQAVEVSEKSSSMDITWPLDRPEGESIIIYNYPSPTSSNESPRPYRYDDGSIPPSQAPSVYSRSASPSDEFRLPEKPIGWASPIPPPRYSAQGWRADSPLPPSPASNPPNFSRPTSPPPALPPAPLLIKRAPPPSPVKRTLPLARSLSAKIASRPKFSLPENLAPFSMPAPVIMKDLYQPPTPPPPSPPRVPTRSGPPERTFSPGRIVAVDDMEVSDKASCEKVRLFPIPDSIIRSEEGFVEQRRREAIAAALANKARERQLERQSSKHSRSQPSSSSGHTSQGSSHGSTAPSEASEEYDDFDSRCPSPAERPSSVAHLGQLQSRFSMSSLGSTIRVNHTGGPERPASARGLPNGSLPIFPSRNEAKKARKLWLQEQEEAKRQSAKMGVEGILGWDAGRKQWVTKMNAEEMQLWLEQWKKSDGDDRRISGFATGRSSHDSHSHSDASDTGHNILEAIAFSQVRV